MNVTSFGGAGTVTGSRHLVDADGTRILVDCGQFQGYKHLRLLNWERFPVPPRSIKAVVLTHAHLDHSGYLPVLVRDGFKGRIHATEATLDLADIILQDAASIQEEDARAANEGRYSKHKPARPLFDRQDVQRALSRFAVARADTETRVADVSALWTPNGHILGSSTVRLSDRGESILWSGDMGTSNDIVMPAPQPRPDAGRIFIEGTYGDALRPPTNPAKALAQHVTHVASTGGTLLVPAFAIGRTQSLLVLLNRIMRDGQCPDVPIVQDSPMAGKAILAMRRHLDLTRISPGEADEVRDRVETTATPDQSKALARRRGPLVLVSSSGMLTGGRVLHHLTRLAGDSRNTILLTGYQAGGTRGADLVAGRRTVRVHGRDIRVKARVAQLAGLSAHADQRGLLAWLGSNPQRPERVDIVHAEPGPADALRRAIAIQFGWPCSVALMERASGGRDLGHEADGHLSGTPALS